MVRGDDLYWRAADGRMVRLTDVLAAAPVSNPANVNIARAAGLEVEIWPATPGHAEHSDRVGRDPEVKR